VYFSGGKPYFWTEQYLLQAYLAHNAEYEILICAYWLQKDYAQQFAEAFPRFVPGRHRPSSSFYMRKNGP
jgi:hypothetical protein